jgi:hypothetical protein
MGHNRAGDRARARAKRRKNHEARLAKKAETVGKVEKGK